jgi:hypothetical protein
MAMIPNPGRTDQGRGRERNDNRFRQKAEARPKDTYYRPEYGWIMSNAQVKAEQGVKGQYDEATAKTEANIEKAKSDFQASKATGIGQINSAYDKALSQATKQETLVPVRVVNGNTVEGTYMLPKSTVEAMNKDSFNKGKGSYTGNWVDNGAFYNVDTRVTGTGGNRGQELHDSLRNAATEYDRSWNAQVAANQDTLGKERSARLSAFEADANKQYEGAATVWNAELAQVLGSYGKRVATGKAQYEESKKKYNDSVLGMDAGLLESPTNVVKTDVKPGGK